MRSKGALVEDEVGGDVPILFVAENEELEHEKLRFSDPRVDDVRGLGLDGLSDDFHGGCGVAIVCVADGLQVILDYTHDLPPWL